MLSGRDEYWIKLGIQRNHGLHVLSRESHSAKRTPRSREHKPGRADCLGKGGGVRAGVDNSTQPGLTSKLDTVCLLLSPRVRLPDQGARQDPQGSSCPHAPMTPCANGVSVGDSKVTQLLTQRCVDAVLNSLTPWCRTLSPRECSGCERKHRSLAQVKRSLRLEGTWIQGLGGLTWAGATLPLSLLSSVLCSLSESV